MEDHTKEFMKKSEVLDRHIGIRILQNALLREFVDKPPHRLSHDDINLISDRVIAELKTNK